MKINEAVEKCHAASDKAGWWETIRKIERLAELGHIDAVDANEFRAHVFATKISLIHSEVSEKLEGLRRGTMDDHLPHYTTEAAEAADIAIRLFDYCGARGIDLETIIEEKMAYNAVRKDHKPEERAKPKGKLF